MRTPDNGGSIFAEIDFGSVLANPVNLAFFAVFFLLGFLLYASIFVGIGSVCNTITEAQNLMGPVTLLLIVPLLSMMHTVINPDSMLSMILTYVPVFTPFVMMNRVADGTVGLLIASGFAITGTVRTADVVPGARLARLEVFFPAFRGSAASLAVLLAVLITALVMLAHRRTRLGREIGLIGLNARAMEAEKVCFSITDTGPGIASEHLPFVFDRGWQARETARKGAGLGLYIAKGIVTAHEGEIRVQSHPGFGSTFSFLLPKGAPASEQR